MRLWLKISLWVLFSGGVITLLVLVERKDQESFVQQPEVHIKMSGNHPFLNKEEVLIRLQRAGLFYEGQKSKELEISKIETFLKSISQVKTVEVYRGFGGFWTINISLRNPIVRIFNSHDESYYLDEDGNKLWTSPVHTAHVLVASGYINDRKDRESVEEIINNDSLKSIRKLDEIYRISSYVCKDTLFRSLIGQLYLEKNGDFVLVPLVGGQKIIFGSAFTEKEVSEKFEKLKIFYHEAIPFEGWDKYSEISLKYRDQIVCKTVEQEQ